MECWEKYNKLLMPLPYKTGWTEHPVRVLNLEQWKKNRKKLSAKIRILGKGCFCVFREQVARLGYMRMENFWAVIMEALQNGRKS